MNQLDDHPLEEAFEVTLRDGTRALIRPLAADDTWRLGEGLTLLSPRSRYLRFHSSINRLSSRQLQYLTEIDHHDRVAWIALDLDHPDDPGMGVGRYERLVGDPRVAEVALAVLDSYQGRGLGTLLLAVLMRSAKRNGIEALRGYVLSENHHMLRILDELNTRRAGEGDGVYRIDVQLPDDPEQLPDTPRGRVMKAMAGAEATGWDVFPGRSAS